MDDNYYLIRKHARELVAQSPSPDFYRDHSRAYQSSFKFYRENSVIKRLTSFICELIDNDFGHGMDHSEKVAVDAGALVIIEFETEGYATDVVERNLLLVQAAGLLHDVKRKQKNHAVRSAEFAHDALAKFPFSSREIEDVCQAIRNHEAFKSIHGEFSDEGLILSDCLYDADKFRWGPDNFTHTVWDMVTFAGIPLSVFMSHFPRGMKAVSRIRDTFRSVTGKQYGPQFIDIGISIGDLLYEYIKQEFPEFHNSRTG